MMSLLPWIALIQGAALTGWLFGAVLRGSVAIRVGAGALAAVVVPSAIFLTQVDLDGYLIAFLVIGLPVTAGAIVMAILPLCFFLETRIGYRFR